MVEAIDPHCPRVCKALLIQIRHQAILPLACHAARDQPQDGLAPESPWKLMPLVPKRKLNPFQRETAARVVGSDRLTPMVREGQRTVAPLLEAAFIRYKS